MSGCTWGPLFGEPARPVAETALSDLENRLGLTFPVEIRQGYGVSDEAGMFWADVCRVLSRLPATRVGAGCA